MASSKATTEEVPVEELDSDADSDDELDDPTEDALVDDVTDDEDDDSWTEADDEDGDDETESGEEQAEDLDELESEELEMLTEDELAETLVVDEAAELRAIRRAELAMNKETGSERGSGEFLCQGCFLVRKTSQLADKRRKLCVDCAG
mgnify:CR=1 FL=1